MTNTNRKHTAPAPWALDRTAWLIYDAEGYQVADVSVPNGSLEQASRIVTAVNQHDALVASHAALVEALILVTDTLANGSATLNAKSRAIDRAASALARAKEVQGQS